MGRGSDVFSRSNDLGLFHASLIPIVLGLLQTFSLVSGLFHYYFYLLKMLQAIYLRCYTDITRRPPEAACWPQMGYWSNNSANRHPSPGAFNNRVLHSCTVPQCSHPPYQPRHQQRLANCDWMPAPYTSGQPSNPRRHPTC